MADSILKGLRILDFTQVLSGPYATRILADFGAEVIKIQSKRTTREGASNLSPYFCNWNRNKRSITLNMGHPDAKDLLLQLAAISDVVVDNFSPRVLRNWGLDYEKLIQGNEKLILLRMPAMGQSGPWRNFTALGPTLQSLGGLTYLTSVSEHAPSGIGFAYADIVSGLYGAIAILAALEYRDRTGRGQAIDLSQYEAICTTIAPAVLAASLGPEKKTRPHPWAGYEALQAAPYGCYACAGQERWCVIAVFNDDEWQSFCRALKCPAWSREKRFTTFAGRRSHKKELDAWIEDWTVKRPQEEIVGLLQGAGVPSGVVQNAEDLAGDNHLSERAVFRKITHPVLGEFFTDTQPIRFDPPLSQAWRPSPLLGEDNRYIFKKLLGFSEEKIRTLEKKGIIA